MIYRLVQQSMIDEPNLPNIAVLDIHDKIIFFLKRPQISAYTDAISQEILPGNLHPIYTYGYRICL